MKSIPRTEIKLFSYVQKMYHKSKVVMISNRTYLSHNCLKYFLSLGLLFGIFPLEGLTYIDPSKLKFRILSMKMLYTVFLLIVYVCCCILAGIKSFSSEMVVGRLISPLFYFHISGIILICTKIANAWPKFMMKLYLEEMNFSRRYMMKSKLKAKLNKIVLVATTAVMTEHVLATANFVFSVDCRNDATGFENYVRKQFHFIFLYLPYNTFSGIFIVIVGWISTYIWNFGDILIVLMCIILTCRFEQLNEKIVRYVKSINLRRRKNILNICHNRTENIDVSFWKNIREDYNCLCQICSITNDLLADMILLSYTCNILFILVQLFVSLRERDGIIETIYFFSSFGFVVARTAIVSIHGGWLSETAKSTLPTLNAVSTEIYNPEIACLINQIHTNGPSMTGHNFFSITKGLVLSVAATTITYELALIQFNQVALKKFSSSNNTVCY